jgi:hypothetical protein
MNEKNKALIIDKEGLIIDLFRTLEASRRKNNI